MVYVIMWMGLVRVHQVGKVSSVNNRVTKDYSDMTAARSVGAKTTPIAIILMVAVRVYRVTKASRVRTSAMQALMGIIAPKHAGASTVQIAIT